MERVKGVIRPRTMLDEWLKNYGYDTNRQLGKDEGVCFFNVEKYVDDEPVDEWLLAGVGADPQEALIDAFQLIINEMKGEYGKGRFVMNVNGIVLLGFGFGRWVGETDEGDLFAIEELPEELREIARLVGVMGGSVPCRVVNVITPSGLAGEVTLFRENSEPHVETVEQWLYDGEGTVPKPLGAVDDALMSTLTFSLLIRDVVCADLPITAKNLLTVAFEKDVPDSITGFIMKVIGEGMEKGLISRGEFI